MQLRSTAAALLPKPSCVMARVPTVEFVDDETQKTLVQGRPNLGGLEQRQMLELSITYAADSCHRRWFLAAANQGPQGCDLIWGQKRLQT